MPPSATAAAPSTSAAPDAKFSTTTSSPPSGAYTGSKAAALLSSRFRERNRDFARPNPDVSHQREGERSVLDTPASSQPAAAPASPAQHKPSAAVHRTSYTTFPPSTLLRPSSLLPALRIAVDSAIPDTPPALDDPFHDSTPHAPEPAKEHDPPGRRGHSRSTSAGGLSDSLRNLNRWSASTTSSRASNLTNFTRRVSSEVLSSAFHSPGRKLHKHKSSTASESPRHEPVVPLRSESPPPVPIPPLKSLPRISIGPSLEEEVRGTNLLGRLSPIPQHTHARRPSDDPGLYWDGTNEELGLSPPRTLDRAEPSMSHAAAAGPATNMPYTQSREARGHSRSRSAGANGVVVEPSSRHRERDRAGRPPSQRAMLSRALEKANTAVQLDNAQNVEGARLAYMEACGLLQQVLQRTAGKEDRDKLEAIHTTYTARINELDELGAGLELDDKELPQRPESRPESTDLQEILSAQIGHTEDDGPGSPDYGRRERAYDVDQSTPNYSSPTSAARRPLASRAPNLSIDVSRDRRDETSLSSQYSLHSAFSVRARQGSNGPTLQPPIDSTYMPPPLSPRRPSSPSHPPPAPPIQRDPEPKSPERIFRADFSMSGARLAPAPVLRGHQRGNSHESVSWLDPIDESAGSSASSVHSRSSSMKIRRRHIRAASGDTEAEFDAALDDAIEAAYDDGYEPESQDARDAGVEDPEEAVANTLRRVELARERVRESEREALILANERERRLRQQQQLEDEEYRKQEGISEDFYDGNDTDEEERILEEMSRGYIIEDFAFGKQPRPSVPRESDSSGWTNRTWHSSMGSTPPTATTILTTVSEHVPLPEPKGPLPPPPPKQVLPQLPPQPGSAGSQGSAQSVRNRRLSGQNPKQLKIETSKVAQGNVPATAGPAVPSQPKPGNYIVQQRQALSAGPRTTNPLSARLVPSPVPSTLRDETSTPPLPIVLGDALPRSGSPSVARPSLRKNFSSSSLKSIKSRNLSVSNINIDDASDASPGTPLSNQFGIGGSSTRLPALPSIPTPLAGTFKERSNSTATGGLYLFENQIHSPNTPGSPNLLMPDAPVPLEPCPNEVLLRPFWLMRCLYQTLCHPRGGYLSNKLFVPRDVWRVKGVKLKNLEDKISNCDYLTAALQKLAKVDTCDADAVLEEMQSLEVLLEQVQGTLGRKLGAEVGVQGVNTMFKDASGVDSEASAVPRSASVTGKGSSFSWRRLRSKGSSANLPGLGATYGGRNGSGGVSTPVDGFGGKETILPSLPMTDHPTSRPAKRDIGSVVFSGPNAAYMSSLAKLFDAAQAIDQIARQVDDPGLRHADKTQVGLELCTRQAAEFFGFYICRFVMSDLTLMLDKFVKRGSEWVLA
ncbi:hypothetical protein QBC34DRAFT_213175 [Podospora aff. communis PSN243]|uniref:MIT domain-containing protein n=1 Tax=Podospora aff. communis PSN243 TaxID=3040156 RepID=A0AAV9G3W9_9PEZI|nr:hypothetical protein QBC34DRAFT_213175 [Podospora aff. communis PSN243]